MIGTFVNPTSFAGWRMRYICGPYEFDTRLYELRYLGTPCQLEHQAFNLLGQIPRSLLRLLPHSTGFSGGVWHRSAKASRGENLEIEEPVSCWDCSSFHFHTTLTRMLGSTLIRDEVVQVC
jgi:hypothetical protein